MSTTSSEPSPVLANAHAQLAKAIETLGYDEGMHETLKSPRREMSVSIPLRRDSGEIEVLHGHRVQHNFSRGPAKGGTRFAPNRGPGRGPRTRHVDDVEVRPAGRPLRRRQGRRRHRPA